MGNDTVAYGTVSGLFINKDIVKGTENERFNSMIYSRNSLLACGMSGFYVVKDGVLNHHFLQGLTTYKVIKVDENNYLIWREKGISKFSLDKMSMTKLLDFDKLFPSYEINYISTRNDVLMLGTDKGLLEMPLSYFYLTKLPELYVRNVSDGHSLAPHVSSINIPYSDNLNIQLKVDVLNNFAGNYSLFYSINKSGNKTSDLISAKNYLINLNSLSHGDYILRFVLTSPDNKIVSERRVALSIIPRWYNTTLFYVSSVMFLILTTGFIFIKYNNKRFRKAKIRLERRANMAELQSQALFSQLKPHFIFNALNPLQLLILKNKKEESLIYLDKFSKLTREMLVQNRTKFNLLSNEIVFLTNYLDIQVERLSHSFNYVFHFNLDSNKESIYIPSMLMQPLLENAIEHGINHKKREGIIRIGFDSFVNEGQLIITIEDNGSGFPENPVLKSNHALQIITERISIIESQYGVGSISFYNDKNRGYTTVKLILPILNDNFDLT